MNMPVSPSSSANSGARMAWNSDGKYLCVPYSQFEVRLDNFT